MNDVFPKYVRGGGASDVTRFRSFILSPYMSDQAARERLGEPIGMSYAWFEKREYEYLPIVPMLANGAALVLWRNYDDTPREFRRSPPVIPDICIPHNVSLPPPPSPSIQQQEIARHGKWEPEQEEERNTMEEVD